MLRRGKVVEISIARAITFNEEAYTRASIEIDHVNYGLDLITKELNRITKQLNRITKQLNTNRKKTLTLEGRRVGWRRVGCDYR